MYLISLSKFLNHILELIYWKSSPKVCIKFEDLKWRAIDLKYLTKSSDFLSKL